TRTYQASPLGQQHAAGADQGYAPGTPLVVLGFWWDRGVRYVASGQAAKILSAADREVSRQRELANTWRTKFRHVRGLHDRYLGARRSLWIPPYEEVRTQMAALGALLGNSTGFAPAGGAPAAFQASEAEARLATFLMANRITGDVHFYATHSP